MDGSKEEKVTRRLRERRAPPAHKEIAGARENEIRGAGGGSRGRERERDRTGRRRGGRPPSGSPYADTHRIKPKQQATHITTRERRRRTTTRNMPNYTTSHQIDATGGFIYIHRFRK